MAYPPNGDQYPGRPPSQPSSPYGGQYTAAWGGQPPPKRNPQLVVALVGTIALAALLGLGAGTFFLLRDENDEGLATICSLIPEKTLTNAMGTKEVESEEIDPKQIPDPKGAQYGCQYRAPGEQVMSTAFVLTVFDSEVCSGEECLDHPLFNGGEPIEGLGDAAVRNWSEVYQTHMITAAKTIRGHTVTVSARGPGSTATEEQTVRLVDRLFATVARKDNLLNPDSGSGGSDSDSGTIAT